jgi:hypothetical protein
MPNLILFNGEKIAAMHLINTFEINSPSFADVKGIEFKFLFVIS